MLGNRAWHVWTSCTQLLGWSASQKAQLIRRVQINMSRACVGLQQHSTTFSAQPCTTSSSCSNRDKRDINKRLVNKGHAPHEPVAGWPDQQCCLPDT